MFSSIKRKYLQTCPSGSLFDPALLICINATVASCSKILIDILIDMYIKKLNIIDVPQYIQIISALVKMGFTQFQVYN